MDQILGDVDASVSDGEDEFTSGTYRCRDDIRYDVTIICCGKVLPEEKRGKFKNGSFVAGFFFIF